MQLQDLQDILIIDDSTLQRLHGCEVCQALGARHIRQATDGAEGLAMMQDILPDLVFLDLEMPRLDGVQVMQAMAKIGLNTPMIVTSGKDYLLISTVELMGRELGLTVLGGLQKPVQTEALRDLLKRLRPTNQHAPEDSELYSEVDIRQALNAKQIIPYYQPKISLSNGHPKGAEMLARWQHPQHGLIPPSRFIPVIEACGWATELTLLMLDYGLKQWLEWARQGIRLPLAVNLSALSLSGEELTQQIEQRLQQARVPPRFIIFEITETAIANNLAEAIGTAARLRLNGFGLAIDDFGTGFATLQQLTRFPFTEMKIDQSLVTSVNNKPHLEAVLNSIIELAQRMQLNTVAEGIETDSDCHFMTARGCQLGQGYFISKPMPALQFEEWVKTQTAQ
ncbi:EAL domain-containing response regulator [Neisseriaceae bacterium TC5R-5]|nr:EAL domain-containing response regulator [Neisseriaceae bacterium TC5R-5]